ncbi:hypothetical protein AB0N17_25825 [Streptomyces sp. NPDC051133]
MLIAAESATAHSGAVRGDTIRAGACNGALNGTAESAGGSRAGL